MEFVLIFFFCLFFIFIVGILKFGVFVKLFEEFFIIMLMWESVERYLSCLSEVKEIVFFLLDLVNWLIS